jgi:ABC-type xylose transport system permease subunit
MNPLAMTPQHSHAESRAAALRQSRALRTAVVLIALWLALVLHPDTRDAFLSPFNLNNLTARIGAEIAIISVGMTFVVLIGGIDLSVGSGMALFGVIAATLYSDHHLPAAVAITVTLAAAVLVGLWHGFLIAVVGIPPFIATLAGFLAYRGLALVLSSSRSLPTGPDFASLGGRLPGALAVAICVTGAAIGFALLFQRHRRRRAFGLPVDPTWLLASRAAVIAIVFVIALSVYRDGMPVPVLFAAAAVAGGGVMLTSTRLGRYAFAIGGNAEAARLSGIPVTRVKITLYVMTAVLTAIAALIVTARSGGVTPGNMGINRELQVISAVVIGGTSLSGGRATMLGTLLGALIFGTLANGMTLLRIDSNWQLIITGAIIAGASGLDSWSTRKERS